VRAALANPAHLLTFERELTSCIVFLRRPESENAPTLVVLLEDLEAMDGKVLTQLIDALACVPRPFSSPTRSTRAR